MATIINNPSGQDSSSGGAGMIFGIIFAIILLAVFFIYALPAIRGSGQSGTNINVPEKVDINVNK